MTRLFIDTNVLIDVLADRKPFVEDSAAIYALVESGATTGSISAVSITNIFYIVRKLASKAIALRAVKDLSRIFAIEPCDATTLSAAIDLDLGDFEDGVQYVTAVRAKAKVIITRNVGHFPKDGIPAMTPTAYLAQR